MSGSRAKGDRKRARAAMEQQVAASRAEAERVSRLACSSFGRKLTWAERHIDSVEASLTAWRSNGYRSFEETDSHGITTIYAQTVRPLSEDVPLLVGDAAQSLLNSLDHLAFAIAGANTPNGLTETQERQSQFPIQRRCPRNDQGVITPGIGTTTWPSCAQAVVSVMQPYLGKEGLNTHPLWLLHDLANRDKHRLLTVATFGHSINEMTMGNGYIDYFQAFEAREIGTEPVPLLAFSRRNYGDMRLRASFDIRFADGPLVAGREVVGTLRMLADYIRTVPVARLAKFL